MGYCIRENLLFAGGMRWCIWLRHCATSWKVAVSIPDSAIGICHWHNPSGRAMTLGSAQPVREKRTRNISWGGKGGRYLGLTTYPPSCAYCLGIWNTQGLSRHVEELLFVLLFAYKGIRVSTVQYTMSWRPVNGAAQTLHWIALLSKYSRTCCSTNDELILDSTERSVNRLKPSIWYMHRQV
jgi:hypothetical protein